MSLAIIRKTKRAPNPLSSAIVYMDNFPPDWEAGIYNNELGKDIYIARMYWDGDIYGLSENRKLPRGFEYITKNIISSIIPPIVERMYIERLTRYVIP